MNTKKTLADVRPGGRVRLGDRPKDGEVLVKVSGLTGSGKSAIAGEIEILCKALGLDAEWVNGDEEKRLTHADWIGALEMYKPKVVIVEQNIPRAAMSAQHSSGSHGERATQEMVEAGAAALLAYRKSGGDYTVHPTHAAEAAINAALSVRRCCDSDRCAGHSALSAQPSPGGQDALATARELLAAEYDKAGERVFADRARKGQYDNDPDVHAIVTALTARQPVGQITDTEIDARLNVLYREMVDSGQHNGGMSGVAWDRAVYRMALSPPAQAVDLGQFRPFVEAQRAEYISHGLTEEDYCVAECDELLDLIDSQAVGNGN